VIERFDPEARDTNGIFFATPMSVLKLSAGVKE